MYNDKIVYTEFDVLKAELRKNYRETLQQTNIHNVIIELNCDSVCQIDCKFGLDLIKIKRETWKTQMAGIADSYLYERYGRNLFRHQQLIDYTFSEIKNINGKDLYDLVFINSRKVTNVLLQIMIELTREYVVVPMELVDFKICEHEGKYNIVDNVFIYQKSKKVEEND